jgi:hypothetical protein
MSIEANIPSNFTLEEVFKFSNLPASLRNKIEEALETITTLEKENTRLLKCEEILEGQIYFRNEFIRSVKERCKTATKCKELVKDILTELEDSYIEL